MSIKLSARAARQQKRLQFGQPVHQRSVNGSLHILRQDRHAGRDPAHVRSQRQRGLPVARLIEAMDKEEPLQRFLN